MLVKKISEGIKDHETDNAYEQISNIDYLKYEEWNEIISLSDTSYMDVSDDENTSKNQEYVEKSKQVEKVLSHAGFSCTGLYRLIIKNDISLEKANEVPFFKKYGINKNKIGSGRRKRL